MKTLVSREPVVTAFLTVVTSLLALLVAFGVTLTEAQKAAIIAFIGAVVALAILVRAAVTPVKTPAPPAVVVSHG
jgi:phosphotransferase system  glucose/maltose/N-acetylglucosamine-specific IIC component